MADDYDDFEHDQPNDSQAVREMRARIKEQNRQAKEQASRLAQLEADRAEAAQAKRELAFLKAGVNPDDPAAKWFAKGYDGELTTEAIKAAATEARLISASAADQQHAQQTAAQLAQHDSIADAGRNAVPSQADLEYEQALARATTPAEIVAIANRFDPRNVLTE
jgi:hypothetical protein